MNEKHKHFCDCYLANGNNGTKAYMDVYPSIKKEESARVNASKLLTNANVIAYLKAEQEKTSQKLEITRESILNDLKRIQANTESTNPQAALKSVELQIKILGLNAPTEQKINITQEQPLFGPLND